MYRFFILLFLLVCLISAAVVFFYLYSEKKNIAPMGIQELKLRWETVHSEADMALETDFETEYNNVIAQYRTIIIDSPDFAYTVFPDRAREEVKKIEMKVSADIHTKDPGETAVVIEKKSKGIDDPVVSKTAENKQDNDKSSNPLSSKKNKKVKSISFRPSYLKGEQEAKELTKRYNRAIRLFEDEHYTKTLDILQRILIQFPDSEFCRKNRYAIHNMINRSRLLAENRYLCLYFYENFDSEAGKWEGDTIAVNQLRGTGFSLKGINAPLPQYGVENTRACLLPVDSMPLFTLEKGQKLNFSFYLTQAVPLHIQMWDKKNNSDYFFDIKGLTAHEWRTVSLSIADFYSLDTPTHTVKEVDGECWYLSFSVNNTSDDMTMMVDEISITGKEIPAHDRERIEAQQNTAQDVNADMLSDFFLFNKTIANHLKDKRDPGARKNTVLVVGDIMAPWLLLRTGTHSPKKIIEGKVYGKKKRCSQIAENISDVLDKVKPEVTVIMVGLSDICSPGEGKPFSVSFERILSKCIASGTIPVVFGVPRIWDEKLNNHAVLVNETVFNYSRGYRVPFIDIRGMFKGNDERSFYNGTLGLSSKGKRKLANVYNNLYRKIKTYIIKE